MLILFYLLLFLYLGLTLLYAVTPLETATLSAWPLLPVEIPEAALPEQCTNHGDCPAFHVCLGGKCIPKLQRTEECDAVTGQWISYQYRGADFAICVCREPELFDQRLFGGNCNVKVGCGVHGTYLESTGTCQCEFGYEAVGLRCVRRPVATVLSTGPCEADEVEQTYPHFHPDYQPPTKCVKKPCSFDALTGKPLQHSEFKPDWGCVCDPRYGLFGVSLAGRDKKYLRTEGYDACALLFREEPDEPHPVELVTYFYLGKREPLSLILFQNVSNPAAPFQGQDWIVAQKLWRYDYAQHFFKTNPRFRVRQRYVYSDHHFGFIDIPVEFHFNDRYRPPPCQALPMAWANHTNERVDVYNVLYMFPVCHIESRSAAVDPVFWDRIVVNPLHLTYTEKENLFRGNAFSLSYDPSLERWTLDLDHEYKVKTFQTMDTNVPPYRVNTAPRSYDPTGLIRVQEYSL